MVQQQQSKLTFAALIILWAIYLLVVPGCVTVNKNYYPIVKRDTVYIDRPLFSDRGIDPGWWRTPYPSLPREAFHPLYRQDRGIVLDTINFKYDTTFNIINISDTVRWLRYPKESRKVL